MSYGFGGYSDPGRNYGSTNMEDDLYEGFNYSIDLAPQPNQSQQAYGVPPNSGFRRIQTGQGSNGEARPMTSVSGAGFSSTPKTPKTAQRSFDPLGDSRKGPAPPLKQKGENSPEEKAKEMEKEVHHLIEQSAQAAYNKEFLKSLDLAKDAGKKERLVSKHRENNNLTDTINHDLTFSVCFNLAHCYHLNDMLKEALDTYSLIVKNKHYSQAGRLRVNMGNIYYQQEKYPSAIKMYRMALDQIPNTGKEQRSKIMRNIGNAFVKMGQFQDAIQSYEEIMETCPDFQTANNLMICYFALGDSEKLRRGFSKLSNIPIESCNQEEEEEAQKKLEEDDISHDYKSDELKTEIRVREKKAKNYILTISKLCAPVIDEKNSEEGYNWIIDELKKSDHDGIASEMEIAKALNYLKNKSFDKAIEILKSFEKKDQDLKVMAATNLSFLYFIEGDINQADKYANLAVKHQRYNAKALVNKGNCLSIFREHERAKELYLEAIGVEADCIEAIYNLGLVNKEMGIFHEALQAFEKLHTIIPSNTSVIYQIANLHDLMHNYQQATKWYNILLTCFDSIGNVADPGVLAKLGEIFQKEEDETQAFHYHMEAYRYFPVDLDVISWLGIWYVKSELYEKAIQFFDRASQVQPQEVKWKLMVASCYRRMGSYHKAIHLYEEIHSKHPDNLECLRYLVAICKELGQPYDQYTPKLNKLERLQASKTQTTNNGAGALTKMGGPGGKGSGPESNQGNNNSNDLSGLKGDFQESKRDEDYDVAPKSFSRKEHPNASIPGATSKKAEVDQSDEWGDADVGELLGD